MPWIVTEDTPALLLPKVWRSPFFVTVTTLGSLTRISMFFVTVYSSDQAPVMDSATFCSPSQVISTHVVAPSSTETATLVS